MQFMKKLKNKDFSKSRKKDHKNYEDYDEDKRREFEEARKAAKEMGFSEGGSVSEKKQALKNIKCQTCKGNCNCK